MDHGAREAPRAARWLVWVIAGVLAVAGVSAGALQNRDKHSGGGVVAAAGRAGSTVAVPTTSPSTTAPERPTVSSSPTTTVRTTVPKAASAVLAAIGTTAPPTTRPSTPATTTTTARPASTTTTARPPSTTSTSTSTTTTAVPAPAKVKLENDHPNAFVLTINGQDVPLASGDVKNVDVVPDAKGNDSVSVKGSTDPSCVANVSGAFFQPGGHYLVTIVAGAGTPCASFPAPELTISPVP